MENEIIDTVCGIKGTFVDIGKTIHHTKDTCRPHYKTEDGILKEYPQELYRQNIIRCTAHCDAIKQVPYKYRTVWVFLKG